MDRKDFLKTIFSAVVLIFEFLLCRFLLFDWHGMKDLPLFLFVSGEILILLSLAFQSNGLRFYVPIGYISGFFIGCLFQSSGTDPGGGRTSDLWLIWASIYAFCILACMIFEIIYRRERRKQFEAFQQKKNRY